MNNQKILAIIPVRGGSKTVPKKNIKLLGGKPLLYYILTAALGSKLLSKVVVSSDDDEILSVAEEFGGKDVVLKRPKELAEDTTPDVPVLQHAVREMEAREGVRYDSVVMLHATTPFIRTEDIDASLKKLIETNADSVVSVYRVTDAHPIKMKKIVDDVLLPYVDSMSEDSTVRRQDLPAVYRRNAGIYASKRNIVMEDGKVWGKVVRPYLMSEERSVDINTLLDFHVAEAVLEFLKSNQP